MVQPGKALFMTLCYEKFIIIIIIKGLTDLSVSADIHLVGCYRPIGKLDDIHHRQWLIRLVASIFSYMRVIFVV